MFVLMFIMYIVTVKQFQPVIVESQRITSRTYSLITAYPSILPPALCLPVPCDPTCSSSQLKR